MSTYLADFVNVITFSERSTSVLQRAGYRWDRLLAVVSIAAALGTVGVSVAAQPLVARAGVNLYAGSGLLRYLGAALQSVSLFWVALVAVVILGAESVHHLNSRMGWSSSRNEVATVIALSTTPIAARSAVLGVAALLGVEGTPVFPWSLVDPTPLWCAALLAMAGKNTIHPLIRRSFVTLVVACGYTGLAVLGLSLA